MLNAQLQKLELLQKRISNTESLSNNQSSVFTEEGRILAPVTSERP